MMNEGELQEYYGACITTTSAEYAKKYIKQASLATLKKCLKEIEGRGYSKTLRKMIVARIRQIERGKS